MAFDTASLLALLAGDPAGRDAQMMQLLTQQLGGASTGDLGAVLAGRAATAPPGTVAVEPTSPSPAATGLYREAELVNTELVRLAHLVADVARALGACARCLGTDGGCTVCAGQGSAGAEEPDAGRFAELVAPAVMCLADKPEDAYTS